MRESIIETFSWAEFFCVPGDHYWKHEGLVEVGIGEREWQRPCPDHDGVMSPVHNASL